MRRLTVTTRRKTLLEDVSFTLPEHETLVVLGPNGAGKSTLMRTMVGIRGCRAGVLYVGGHDVQTKEGRRLLRTKIGYQPQNAEPPTNFSIREAVRYAAWLKQVPPALMPTAVDRVLVQVNLHDKSNYRIGKLSGGELKRVLIAQAMVHQPSLIVFDEPTADLDPLERRSLLEIVAAAQSETTIVFATHDLRDAEFLATRILALRNGRVAFYGDIDEFVNADAAHDIESAYQAILGA